MDEIIEIKEAESRQYFVLSNGTIGTGFEISIFDQEVESLEKIEFDLTQLLRNLSPRLTVRILLSSEVSTRSHQSQARHEALNELGFIENKAFIVIEEGTHFVSEGLRLFKTKGISLIDDRIQRFSDHLPLGFLSGTTLRPLTRDEIAGIFQSYERKNTVRPCGIDFGSEILSILRLTKQSTYPLSLSTLSELKDQLPLPYSIQVNLKALSPERSEDTLRRKSRQALQGDDKLSVNKYVKAQDDLAEVALSGTRILEFEFLVLIFRRSEESLRTDAYEIIRKLQHLGDFYQEEWGLKRTYEALRPGSPLHYPILEKDDVLTPFLPLLTRGSKKKDVTSRSLALQRLDESVEYVDLFNPSYDSYSTCIFGASGSGKSVLTNLLTRSLLFDESVHMIKLDVGGSHSKETELLGGREYRISLDEPAGINPFQFLKKAPGSPEVVQILSAFLETLLLEQQERFLSKDIKSDIEKALFKYSENLPSSPSLDDFVKSSRDLPRKKLLERWMTGGVFGNAFSVSKEDEVERSRPRLKYFNFAKISQALDSDFAQGGLAAVMSEFNFNILFNRNGKRFIFVADEVPIFIERCFPFFALSIANIRKNGDAFIVIAQRSEHVVVGGNTSILDNSPQKFIFSLDGDADAFQRRLHLEKSDLLKIKNLQRRQGEFSEVFFQDTFGKRVFRIRLTPQEYWAFTSKKEDREKLDSLKAIFPNSNLKEIIRCASLLS
jgi:hypothetical protein